MVKIIENKNNYPYNIYNSVNRRIRFFGGRKL